MKRVITASVKSKKNTSIGSDVAKYQEWVDFDMKRYGRISKKTTELLHKAGLDVVKDQYGEYEVISHDPDQDANSCDKITAADDLSAEDRFANLLKEINDDFDYAISGMELLGRRSAEDLQNAQIQAEQLHEYVKTIVSNIAEVIE